MIYSYHEEERLKRMAEREDIRYRSHYEGCDFDEPITDRYGNTGRYEYGGMVYKTKEQRDYDAYCARL